MGLILVPLVIFWILALCFSLRIGYVLLAGKPLIPFISIAVGCSIGLALLYAGIGLFSFKARDEVALFEIPLFFALNKGAMTVFAMSGLAYIFGDRFLSTNYLKVIVFTLSFGTCLGTLIGVVGSETFATTFNITERP